MHLIHQTIEAQDIRGSSLHSHLSDISSGILDTDSYSSGETRLPVSPLRVDGLPNIVSRSSAVKNRNRLRLSTSEKIQELFAPFESPGPEDYPSPEDYEMESRYTPQGKGRARQNSTASLASAVTTRLSWFKSKTFTKSTDPYELGDPMAKPRDNTDDPLLSLDLVSSLFPHGESDRLNPTGFDDLLANAQTLISKLQASYRLKCEENEALRIQAQAQADELDESETRAQHLKAQLDDMSIRMARNEEEFSEKLREEQQKREEVETRWQATLDESTPRLWSSTRSENSDSGFESEGESEPKTPSSGHFSPLPIDDNMLAKTYVSPFAIRPKAGLASFGAYQQDSLFGFDSDLRAENQELKGRIAELETVVDSCLLLL